MTKKPLSNTNPHLQDPEKYHDALNTNVASTTAVETGKSVKSVATKLAASIPVSDRSTLYLKKKSSDR